MHTNWLGGRAHRADYNAGDVAYAEATRRQRGRAFSSRCTATLDLASLEVAAPWRWSTRRAKGSSRTLARFHRKYWCLAPAAARTEPSIAGRARNELFNSGTVPTRQPLGASRIRLQPCAWRLHCATRCDGRAGGRISRRRTRMEARYFFPPAQSRKLSSRGTCHGEALPHDAAGRCGARRRRPSDAIEPIPRISDSRGPRGDVRVRGRLDFAMGHRRCDARADSPFRHTTRGAHSRRRSSAVFAMSFAAR
jgi:hypothetical protein